VQSTAETRDDVEETIRETKYTVCNERIEMLEKSKK
jgi:hypothetical protein